MLVLFFEKKLFINLFFLSISSLIIDLNANIDAEGTLVITPKENMYITDARYIEHVHSILTLFDEIVVYDARGLSKEDYENFFMFCENVGFEENYVTYAKYKEYMHKYKINCLVETENMIEKQRLIKDEEEIESRNLSALVRKIKEYISFLKGNINYKTDFYELGDGISVSKRIEEK